MYSKILIIKYNLLGGNMKKYKSILISVGWFFIALIVYLLFVTTLAHFKTIKHKQQTHKYKTHNRNSFICNYIKMC